MCRSTKEDDMDYPCKNCPDRAIGCHGHCDKYLAVREEQRLQGSNAWRKRIGDIAMDDYKQKVIQRTRKQYDRRK